MSKIGVGILGWAHGHVTSYSHGIKTFDDFELVNCWDHDVERGEASAKSFEMDFSPAIEDVVNDPRVKLCIIGAETNRHADCVIAAAEAGKDVILQKPMALSMADCDRIIDVVDKTGVFFSLAFQMRYDPVNIRIKNLCDSGAVGKVGIVRRRHCLSMLLNPDFGKGGSAWHVDPVQNIGMWMDDSSHATDWFLWMLGEPVSVMAEVDNVLTHHTHDDTGMAIYRFGGGEMGLLLNSSVVLAAENTVEVYGDKGVIIMNHGDGPSTGLKPPNPIYLKMYQADKADLGWQIIDDIPLPDNHGWRIQNVARNILNDYKAGKPEVTAREGKISTGMVLSAYQSASEGRRIALPLK